MEGRPMTTQVRYLYRGTTRDWPGNECLRHEGVTCTTTDPLVATLFAIESRNHGPAVILAVRRGVFEELAESNYFSVIGVCRECSDSTVRILPLCGSCPGYRSLSRNLAGDGIRPS